MAFLSTITWVFSLAISYSMHLVISTHPSIFWVAYHPSTIFPLKEFEREPQNKLSPSPHHQTISFLTSNPWPTTHVLVGYKLVVPRPYVCSTSVYVQNLPAAHAFAMDWRFVYAFCHSFLISYGAIWSMPIRPLSSLLYTLLSIGYNVPVWSLGFYLCYFGLSWPITLLVGFFGPFLFPWHPRPIF